MNTPNYKELLKSKQNKYGLILLIVLIILVGGGKLIFNRSATPASFDKKATNSSSTTSPGKSDTNNEIPKKVYDVYNYIIEHDEAPDEYVGGRTFQNREKKLPRQTDAGETIQYREWDVNPKQSGQNRGKERLVTGDNKSAYYTNDHYKTFQNLFP